MAVTGLPQKQPDHAVIMAKFAMECMGKIDDVTGNLVGKLGQGTEKLSLRMGLHSGPVTAGEHFANVHCSRWLLSVSSAILDFFRYFEG